MSEQRFYIRAKLPSLNQYILSCRSHRLAGAKLKKKAEQQIIVAIELMHIKPITTPCFIAFEWHEKNKRTDHDNRAFSKKFILDALQKCGVLPNDNQEFVVGFTDSFVNDNQDGVFVTINEKGGK